MNRFNYFWNILFMTLLFIGIFSFFKTSFNRNSNNLANFQNFQVGTILKSYIVDGPDYEGSSFYFENEILIKNNMKTIIKSKTNFELQKGDRVKVRYVGTEDNNIIFEVNGKIIGSPYDWFDYASPFITLFSSFLIYWIFLAGWIERLKKKYFKIFVIILLFSFESQAQNFDVFCSSSPYLANESVNFKIHFYEPRCAQSSEGRLRTQNKKQSVTAANHKRDLK